MDEFIHIHRWEDFQHDKRRKGAPWHKEHAAQLDNDAYLDLSLGARGLLAGLRLMYGRRHPEGVSVANARRLLTSTANDAKHFGGHLQALSHAGFITVCASKTLATRLQGASTPLAQEVEEESEVEVEEEKDNPGLTEARTDDFWGDDQPQDGKGPGSQTQKTEGVTDADQPQGHLRVVETHANGPLATPSQTDGPLRDGVVAELARLQANTSM